MSKLKKSSDLTAVKVMSEDIVVAPASLPPRDSKLLMQMLMEQDLKPVRGIFRNHECKGTEALVQIRKYPGHFFNKKLTDGYKYEIPLYVALHLNGIDRVAEKIGGQVHTCAVPTHGYRIPESGRLPDSVDNGRDLMPVSVPVRWDRRYSFDSLEFDAGF